MRSPVSPALAASRLVRSGAAGRAQAGSSSLPAGDRATANELCTLLDVRYLPRGLVLYESLREQCADFRLRVLCMDQLTKELLDELALPSLTTIRIEELEAHDPGLARVRADRSPIEYCWTATASLCLFCLEREPDLPLITYLDADLRFYADPSPLLDELERSSILVTPHRFARRWRWLAEANGRYNVQLVSFRRDGAGLGALRWWRERCLEWCHNRVEDDRFGDQRYLDDWPERFASVRVLEHPSAGLGPWSSGRYPLELVQDRILIDGRPLVFYHFHGFRLSRPPRLLGGADRLLGGEMLDGTGRWASDFPLTAFEREAIWAPYAARILEENERVLALVPELRPVLEPRGTKALGRRLALRTPAPLPALASRARRLPSRRVALGVGASARPPLAPDGP